MARMAINRVLKIFPVMGKFPVMRALGLPVSLFAGGEFVGG